MKYEYECWKCPKWHETDSLSAMRYARVRIVVKDKPIVLPRVEVLYAAANYRKSRARVLFWDKFGKCTECGRIKLKSNLWYAEPGAAWCRRCM